VHGTDDRHPITFCADQDLVADLEFRGEIVERNFLAVEAAAIRALVDSKASGRVRPRPRDGWTRSAHASALEA
jgi:hypothetical protein